MEMIKLGTRANVIHSELQKEQHHCTPKPGSLVFSDRTSLVLTPVSMRHPLSYTPDFRRPNLYLRHIRRLIGASVTPNG